MAERRLLDPEPDTLAKVGQDMGGLSRERIRQLEAQAIGKMKRAAQSDWFRRTRRTM